MKLRYIKTALSCLAFACVVPCIAAPVSAEDAMLAAQTWIRDDDTLETVLPLVASNVVSSAVDVNGNLVHAVNLEGGGYVITSGDDRLEPIIAFSDDGEWSATSDNPLWVMIQADISNRMSVVERESGGSRIRLTASQSSSSSQVDDAIERNTAKWRRLTTKTQGRMRLTAYNGQSSISDVRVAPLVKSKWSQGSVSGGYCYNYYTPNHWPCGCVATAMAQVMRYYEWPKTSVTPKETSSGKMKGGYYNWSNMPLEPGYNVPDVQREAIGKLTSDVGISIYMNYGASGSGASPGNVPPALKSTYGYANALKWYAKDDKNGFERTRANLDMGCPLMWGISRTDGGHEVVVDGYGYSSQTLYFHVNLGWGGSSDAWYNPNAGIYTTSYEYSVIDSVVGDIFPTQANKVVVTGRVMSSLANAPIKGAKVQRISSTGQVLAETTSNEKGIWGFYITPGDYSRFSASWNGGVASYSSNPYHDYSHTIPDMVVPGFGSAVNITFSSFDNAHTPTYSYSKTVVKYVGDVYGELPTPNPREGYSFDGWYTAKNGGTKVASSTKVTETVTYYAHWTASRYTVKFDANGGTGTMDAVARAYNDDKALPKNSFKRTNYTFQGWATSSGGGVTYKDRQQANLTSTNGAKVTLYAVWSRNTYSVRFNANAKDAAGSMAKVTFEAGATVRLPANAFSRTGYTFAGWNTKADGSSFAYKDAASVKDLAKNDGETVPLYAQWTPNKYTVAFNANGGTGKMKNVSRVYNDEKVLPKNSFKRTNYTLKGWATSKGGSVQYTDRQVANLSAVNGATVTLYAVWGRKAYTVVFKPNGGTGTMNNLSIDIGASKKLTANAFTRAGYTFTGWNTKSNGKGKSYKNKAKVKDLSTKDGAKVTLYAVWKAYSFKLAFDANGGTGSAPKTIAATSGKAISLPANPFKRKGYVFLGWSTGKKATLAQYKDKAKVKDLLPPKNGAKVTLYAVWSRSQYTVCLDPNGATSGAITKKVVGCGSGVILANTFRRDGYVFKGWATAPGGKVVYPGDKAVKDIAKIGEAITLYAVWSLPDWACGEFCGWIDYIYGSPSQVLSGPASASVSALGALSGKATIENYGSGSVQVAFSADKYSECRSGLSAYDLAALLDDDYDDYEILEDIAEHGLASNDITVYIYKGVTLRMPIDSTTKIVDIIVASYPYDAAGGRIGMLLFSLADDNLSAMMTQNLLKTTHLVRPQFNGTPVTYSTSAVLEYNTSRAASAISGLTELYFAFASDGTVTLTAYGKSGKWAATSHLQVHHYLNGTFRGQVDFLTKDGCDCWVDVQIVPGKDGKVSSDGITVF